MNGIEFANKLNRRSDIYRKNLADNRKSHESEVENLKKTHAHIQKSQQKSHKNQLEKVENSHQKISEDLRTSQNEALREKNQTYEKSLNKFKEEHDERTQDNIRTWDKKISDIKKSYDNNITDTKNFNKSSRDQMENYYDDSIKDIRKTARKDLDGYLATNKKQKKNSDIQAIDEKNALIRKSETEKSEIIKNELGKRNFMQKNMQEEINANKNVDRDRYLAGRSEQETRFKNMVNDVNSKVDSEITEREDRLIKKQVEANKDLNVQFSDRFDNQSKKYERDIRNLEVKKRAEALSEGETAKNIQEKYRENLKKQVETQRETQMRERFDVEKKYSKRLDDTVVSFQDSIRDMNIDHAEKTIKTENELLEVNRKDRYNDKVKAEKLSHDHQVSLNYVKDQQSISAADDKRNTNTKIETLKENFNKSMQAAQKDSKENFEITREAMLNDKRALEKRLHEQNSNQSTFLKEVYNEKIDKISAGYEKRIQQLELQNKMLAQNTHDSIQDITRKTTAEIDRQRKAAQDSAKNQVATERALSNERESQLNDKIKNLQANFAEKMNNQTLAGNRKVKEVQFQANERLQSESNRYKDIIDQNNKFMAREVQRLQLASSTERQRLITQYEDKIQQLQKVYSDKSRDIEQYNQLNKA